MHVFLQVMVVSFWFLLECSLVGALCIYASVSHLIFCSKTLLQIVVTIS